MKKLSEQQIEELKTLSNTARGAILKMTSLAKSGHPGGSMSSIDYLLTLYNMINVEPKNPNMEKRDRVVFSIGHISPAAYATLGLMRFFDLDDAISQFRLAGSIFEGHVEPDVPGIEWASGNLGQGLSAACGFALACRQQNIDNNIFVLMGDGEQQKGQLSEARRFAVKYDLNNIIAYIDYNKLQISGDISKVMPQNIKENYISDGWKVFEIDGHDLSAIQDTILEAEKANKPSVIIAKTIMGKGVSFMENREKYHGSVLNEDQLSDALNELGLQNDFDKFKKNRSGFIPPKLDHKIKNDFEIPFNKPIIYTEKTDNRSAWGNAVADIAKSLTAEQKQFITVFDNDLQGSVKTNKFEEILPDNYYQTGIMEHHTATMAGAMSKEGIQVFFPGFGVFGIDETYNQHRLNDINDTNINVITTHVGLDVGEDGKTHQCIDYVGVMKNLFNFKIIVPADANQTDRVIRHIYSKYGNFSVSMGRSKYPPITNTNGSIFFDENYNFEYGKADKLREGNDATLLVMGTLSNNAIEISDILNKEGINLSVWNVSCPNDLDDEMISEIVSSQFIFIYEDHNVNTGLGNSIAVKLFEQKCTSNFYKFGVENYALSGTAEDVFRMNELDVQSIVRKIKNLLVNK
ncbi:MAG: transketolase [Candidatus Cloacimonetes bacterium]|nr:transketolase [Candidatus Cloacimonadota bacterium]